MDVTQVCLWMSFVSELLWGGNVIEVRLLSERGCLWEQQVSYLSMHDQSQWPEL